jgi:carboxyl-terminal processing protease
MKIKLLCLLFVFIASTQAAQSNATQTVPLVPTQQQSQAAHLSAEVLARYHYKPLLLDDKSSSKIFDAYLKSLDEQKIFFLQSDIDHLSTFRTMLDDAILKEDLSIPFEIFNIYQQRIADRIIYARSLLKNGFDFTVDESYPLTREKSPWAKSQDEINDIWRKRVKNDWLRLKLAGKNNKSIIETLDKRYESYLKSNAKIKNSDVFQSFMNAYTMTIDPHTNYFGIQQSDDFDISMKLSLVGIGAVLQDKDEYTTIRELVTGSPAALSGKLEIGDRIVGVGQSMNGAITDVMGWRLDDTVALIRGAENSVVVLDILPVKAGTDSKHKLITLTRKKISLEQQAAKKSIIKVTDNGVTHQIGVISLPVFYQDFEARQNGDKSFKSATRDVSLLLNELKKDKVDSVLLDLRNNGGGSLDEAIELTGLFINKGPVLQERNVKGTIKVDSDTSKGALWDGPLGVLINRGSASASEIFAAAIQDYGRGVIIGEQSFGKGTVQTLVNLDQLAKNDSPKYGELKMTIAQFFRINGSTTQLRGVTPDISLPTITDLDNSGESGYDNPLPWTQIKAAEFTSAGDLKMVIPKLIANHNSRISKDKDFQYLQEDITEYKNQLNKNLISLSEAQRIKEREQQDNRLASREKTSDSHMNDTLQDDGLQINERNLNRELEIEKIRKNTKDILLNEATNILNDEINIWASPSAININ